VRTVLNVIWLVLSGIWLALAYTVAGVLMCVLIITIPFGIAAFRVARYVLWPFGRTLGLETSSWPWWRWPGWAKKSSPRVTHVR
jgi:uncharacterized membrane protein YccF (DUF307 family)